MPELPEVESIKKFLTTKILDKTIIDVQVNRYDLRQPITKNISDIARNQKILQIIRRGKYLILHLQNNYNIVIHLGMSGNLLYFKDQQIPPKLIKHNHVTFLLNDNILLAFIDPRRFGLVVLLSANEQPKFFRNIGIEPLTSEFNKDVLQQLLAKKASNIKTFLMNNNIITGIGNIYASEILFDAKISPLRTTKDLLEGEIEKLTNSIKNILTYAITEQGASFKDYLTPSGISGNFQNCFKVYSRKEYPCYICNNKIIQFRQNGRSTFYCQHCQK